MADRKGLSRDDGDGNPLMSLQGADRIRFFMERSAENHTPDYVQPLLPHLTLLALTPPSPPNAYPTATFLFTPQLSHSNALRNLHGGATATLFDLCTTLALLPLSRPAVADQPPFWLLLGVSRTLSVTYLRPAPEGEPVTIACTVLAIGRRTASIRGEMRRKADGALLATCEHGKVNTDPAPGGGRPGGGRGAKL